MVGQTISHYRILSKLGEGGMGVVYKAEDTKLDRTVALKFLAPHLVADEAVRKRFTREAKAAAALDHPNICTVFEIDEAEGTIFLAMAFVEGRTVKDLIAERPLKLGEALDIATQTAEGIRAAHEKGIVHQDIKPANVMINLQEQVKIMDFGLARLTDATLTQTSSIAGTPAYMSPEQAQAQPADRRTDIWSLGVMLYEMVTGRLPFGGDSVPAILHAIAYDEPEPVTALRAGLPLELDWIIGKCLAKNPAERYQHLDDLMVDLSALRKKLDSGASVGATAGWGSRPGQARASASGWSPPRRRIAIRKAVLFAGALAAVAVLVWVAARTFRRAPEVGAPRTVKFTFTPARLGRGSDTDIDAEVSISPDGKHITYVESENGQLWVRDIDQEQAHLVPGATRVYQVFWSPDNQFIGYSVGRDLMRIPAQGGTPVLICKLAGDFRRASWSSDGETIVYCDQTGLYTVPAKGGPATRVIEHPHIEHPSFLDLPNGRRAFLFQAVDNPPKHGIYVQVAGEDRRRLLTLTDSSNPYPAYSPTGHIVYVDGAGDSVAIWALPFSLATLQPAGQAFPIAQRGSSPQVSRTGTLVYSDVPSDRLQLVWCDRSGARLSTIGEPQRQDGLTLSPDGRRLAVQVREGDPDIWVYDLERGIKTRFTFDSAADVLGAWTPSGDEITYASSRSGNFDIFTKPSGGNGEARLLVGTPLAELAPDWSPDRRFLMYEAVSPGTKSDLLYRERRPDGSLGEPAVFLQTPFEERAPRFSPDGRLVAYASNESGQFEIYVRGFPNGASRWQISANGGVAPRWRRDGKEIFYVQRGRLMAVSVSTQPAFSPGPPAPLFEKRSLQSYDVSADGKRFIVRDRLLNEAPLSIHVVHNWFEEFRGLQGEQAP